MNYSNFNRVRYDTVRIQAGLNSFTISTSRWMKRQMQFMFKLTQKEKDELVTICDHLNSLKFFPNLPFVFTEQGVSMLSAVLHSKISIKISIEIIKAFVQIRRFLQTNQDTFKRLNIVETKVLEHDNNFKEIFKQLERNLF